MVLGIQPWFLYYFVRKIDLGRGITLRKWLSIVFVLLFIIYFLICFDLSFITKSQIFLNIKILTSFLFGLLPLLILIGVIIGLMNNKWAFKIEKLSLGGFNIIFDDPVKLYKRSVRSFLDTKRTLFKIDFERDNFDETLTSYYQTYEFFRTEMKILDNERKRGLWNNREQQELYEVTNRIIQMLNEFLTSHQNNFRRWYKYVSENNEVKRIDGKGTLEFHMTPIHEIQRHYYHYNEICKGFKEINEYFMTEVNRYFQINHEKWERVEENA
jgi:hypothetical protein